MCVTSVCDLNGKMSISGVNLDKVTETKVTDKDLSWANILPHIYTSDIRRLSSLHTHHRLDPLAWNRLPLDFHQTTKPTLLTTFWRRKAKKVNDKMNLIWSLCLLCLTGGLRAACARPVRKTSRKNAAAPQEEANVLVFGVLQFSHSLKHISQTTEAKMAQIGQTLKNHEGMLQRLGRHAEEAAKIKKQIQAVVMLLQVSEGRSM